ncbi:hypothetical protein ACWD6R_26105 [Streptomyces sp. NPDC005151]
MAHLRADTGDFQVVTAAGRQGGAEEGFAGQGGWLRAEDAGPEPFPAGSVGCRLGIEPRPQVVDTPLVVGRRQVMVRQVVAGDPVGGSQGEG